MTAGGVLYLNDGFVSLVQFKYRAVRSRADYLRQPFITPFTVECCLDRQDVVLFSKEHVNPSWGKVEWRQFFQRTAGYCIVETDVEYDSMFL